MAPFILDSCYSPELILDSLGRLLLEFGLVGGLEDTMWVVLRHLAVDYTLFREQPHRKSLQMAENPHSYPFN